jgi:muramoyltetrapeptide carboxypeptidase
MPTIPPKLCAGDQIRVIAPSRSLSAICKSPLELNNHSLAEQRLRDLGLTVSSGAPIRASDPSECPPAAERLADLHEAFMDPEVKGIITVIGGWNGNQILREIDYGLIAANPKVFCGYSDITVFSAAFLAQADRVTYSGPHISTFGMRDGIEYTIDGFKTAVMLDDPSLILPSSHWSENAWYADQDARKFHENPGHMVLQEGEAEGVLIGGNIGTLALLNATEFMPLLAGAVLCVEDLSDIYKFDRQLQSLLHQPGGDQIAGLVIGRFPSSDPIVSRELLDHVVRTKASLRGVPVIYGVDFGHTAPHITVPVGGRVRLKARGGRSEIMILEH